MADPHIQTKASLKTKKGNIRSVKLTDIKKIAAEMIQEILDLPNRTNQDRVTLAKYLKEQRETMQQIDVTKELRELKKKVNQ